MNILTVCASQSAPAKRCILAHLMITERRMTCLVGTNNYSTLGLIKYKVSVTVPSSSVSRHSITPRYGTFAKEREKWGSQGLRDTINCSQKTAMFSR